MPRKIIYSHIMIIIFAFCGISSALADIVITGTRFVYPEKEREVTVKIDNVGDNIGSKNNYRMIIQTFLF